MSSGLLWLLGALKKKKQELIALLTQIALKVAQGRYSCSCFAVRQRWYFIPNAVRSQISTKFFSASAPAELCEWFSWLLVLGLALARWFEGFVYGDGTARKRTRTLSVPSLGKIGKCFNGGFVVALGYRKGTCVDLFISGPGRWLDLPRKAERLSGLFTWPSPGGTACRRVPETGKTLKLVFPL